MMMGTWRIFYRLFILLLLVSLSGCMSKLPKSGSSGRGGASSNTYSGTSDNSHLPQGKPYTVRGKTYRPYTSAHGFSETGVASWYGPGFHGKTTANGEKYNQNAMTAAHKLLPFNTQIKVTNLDNGLTTMVRINDRGPFVGDRVIDLSHQAASRIGMIQKGTARVRLEAVGGDRPVLTPDGDMLGRFYVQVGVFRVVKNANSLLRQLNKLGFKGRVHKNSNTGLHYVQVGPYPSVDSADEILGRLNSRFPGIYVIAE